MEPVIKNKTFGIAEYRRIEIDLRAQILDGRWPIGGMLPSRRDLARQFNVSLVTLDRAIGPLLADGTLRADDRRGTFLTRLSALKAGGSDARISSSQESDSVDRDSVYPNSVDREKVGLQPRSGLIGVIASIEGNEGQQYFIVHELEQIFSHQGHTTFVLNRSPEGGTPLGLSEAIEKMLEEDLAALTVVCLDIDTTVIGEEISRVNLRGMPTVCILAGGINLSIPHVFYDNRRGGYQAAHHLLERGWKTISVIAPFTASWVSERVVGIRDALSFDASAGAVQVMAGEGREWDIHTDPKPFGYHTARAAFALGWKPGGVICVNDGVATGVLDAAAEQGLEPGKDFAILGFDDEPIARTLGLTSVRPPMQGMAREAARLLSDHVRGEDISFQVRLRAHVIPRASTHRADA